MRLGPCEDAIMFRPKAQKGGRGILAHTTPIKFFLPLAILLVMYFYPNLWGACSLHPKLLKHASYNPPL